MPIYGLWSSRLERWYIDATGVIFNTDTLRLAQAQFRSIQSGMNQQKAMAAQENRRRAAAYQEQRAKRIGIALPKLSDNHGRQIPGAALNQATGPGAPQMVVVDDPGWKLASIGKGGAPADILDELL